MPLSSAIKQAEEALEEVLRAIREESEKPTSVLCETDRKHFVEEEESLRKQLRKTEESEPNWRSLLCIPSPQAARCLQGAEALRRRVKEDISTKLRTRLMGMSNPAPLSSHRQESVFDSTDARAPEADARHPLAGASSPPVNEIITSPLNMRCSTPDVSNSEVIVYAAGRNGNNHTPISNEPTNTSLDTSSVQSRNSSSGSRRRSPPPPPRARRAVQSSDSRLSMSNPGSGSPVRSPSFRRPAPPPPQSTRPTTPSSPVSGFFTSTGPLSPNLAMMSSISELTQQVDKLVSSVVNEDLSRQARGRRKRYSEDFVAKVNCLEFKDSNADGVTLNVGGSKNSGSVVHKTVWPGSSHPVAQA